MADMLYFCAVPAWFYDSNALGNRGGDTGFSTGCGTGVPASINNSPVVKGMQNCRWMEVVLVVTKRTKSSYLTDEKGSIYSKLRCNEELQISEEKVVKVC